MKKDEITSVPLCIKLHNVPIVAYLEVGLSLITTQLGRPIMLDSYTSIMCLKSWGRNTYARALVEVSADKELMDSLVVAIPFPNGKGNCLEKIEIKYEWEPPRCSVCRIFDHIDEQCPKNLRRLLLPNSLMEEEEPDVGNDDSWKSSKPYTSTNVSLNDDVWQSLKPLTVNESDSEEIEELTFEEPVVKSKNEANANKGQGLPVKRSLCIKGSRIILGWNPKDVNLVIILLDAQVIHTRVWFKADQKELFCSFVYAHNRYIQRRGLWSNLALHKHYIRNRPWSLLGDFNVALNLDDKSVGSSNFDISMRELRECVEDIEVSDVNYTGLKFTWNQKPKGDDGVLKKIDRIMDNMEFYDFFVGAYVIFQPYRILDHAPAVLNVPMLSNVKPETFKFSNVLREEEAAYVKAFNDALLMEDQFLKQKDKIEWLRVGDSNSAYFHKMVKGRIHRSRIDAVTSTDGTTFTGDQDIVSSDVIKAMKEFFTNDNLLKEVNHTIIALIPKVASPTRINDYRLISYCNVIYKCISKIIANRIKDSLKNLVSPNQSAFVPGQRISDNILLTQEIMHNYHLDRGPPRETWSSSRRPFISLPIYSYNGGVHSYASMKNDLFLFAHGDANSAHVIMTCLDEFKGISGLVPSLPKSTAYFCNVLNHAKLAILNIISFEEGRMSVKYLGVPLISSRLIYRDCKELIDKVQSQIQDWKNRSLLAAGRAFLWCQGDMHKGKAKVAWEVICLPRNKGGLGIRKLDVFNKALMVTHIWNLLSHKVSLWVGIGNTISSWFDCCSSISPLSDIISACDIHSTDFTMTTKLSETIVDDSLEYVEWRHLDVTMPFNVSNVWESIHPRGDEISWCDVFWFSQCISRHAFHLWLVIKRKLKTQDNLRQWDVWNHMKIYAGLSQISSMLNSIIDYLIPISKRRSARGIVARLVFAATSYFIWQERNHRLFKNQKRSHIQLIECIKSNVQLNLLTCTFKKTRNVMAFMHLWKLPDSVSSAIS
ncbi:hypothetical protein Tco_0468187 [Tanacetum coccineum]